MIRQVLCSPLFQPNVTASLSPYHALYSVEYETLLGALKQEFLQQGGTIRQNVQFKSVQQQNGKWVLQMKEDVIHADWLYLFDASWRSTFPSLFERASIQAVPLYRHEIVTSKKFQSKPLALPIAALPHAEMALPHVSIPALQSNMAHLNVRF